MLCDLTQLINAKLLLTLHVGKGSLKWGVDEMVVFVVDEMYLFSAILINNIEITNRIKVCVCVSLS